MDRKDYKYIYNSLNKNGSDRNFNYPIYIRNKEVATQEWVSKIIEGGLEGLEGNYLTIAQAAEIYLSKVDAQNTYLTQVNAQNIYLSKNDANTTYLTNERAQSTYQRKGNYVTLNSSNQIDSSYLPSYVDDVLEYNTRNNFPSSGESGKIYVATDTNLTYRWGGSEYVEISKSLALGETSSTAYYGNKGAENRTRIEALENNINNKVDKVTGKDLSSNDFTNTYKNKLDNLKNVATTGSYNDLINRPTIPTKTSQLTNDSGYITSYTDTKNTAGSTDTSSKIFLIGATSQATNPQTYSHDTAYVGTDGCLYSNNTKVSVEGHTHSQYITSENAYTKEEINTKLNGKSDVGHTHSEYLTANDIANKADKGTKLSDYGITDAYTKTDIDGNFVKQTSLDKNDLIKGVIVNQADAVGIGYYQQSERYSGTIFMQDYTEAEQFNIKIESADNFGGSPTTESQILVGPDHAAILSVNHTNNFQSAISTGHDEGGTNQYAALIADDGTNNKTLLVTPTSANINDEEIATQTWVQNQLGGFTIDAYTKKEVDTKLNLKANLSGGNTFDGLQTINAPTNTSGSEQATVKIKTANGGAIVLGKEGPNSGTMLRLDQKDGTCRLRFRSSATAGAMVWEQPEQGAQLYIDLGKDGADKHRIQFPSSAGTLALKSQIPKVNNGTLTIQKNGTNVQTFTANQSGNVTANIIVPTKTSELTNDSGFLTSHQDISGKADKADTLAGYGITDAYTKTEVNTQLSGKLPIVGAASSGETKTYNRYAQKGYSGGGSTYWYYKIATLPVYNSAGNYASLIITGRIGGWEAGNMSSINALVFNRGAEGIVAIDLAKISSSTAYNICDIVCYREADGTTSVYLKCAGYFTFDINVESYQSDIVLPTSVSKLTSVTGTEQVKLSTTQSRLEVYNGNAYVGGTRLIKSNESLKNPNALTFGSKTYDGSSAQTITASDLNSYTKTEVDNQFNSLHSVATTGSYNDLSDKPTIPTKTSELTNDSGYLSNVAITSSSSGTKKVSGKAGTTPEDLGDGAVYKLRGTENIGLGATNVTITPTGLTKSATGSYNSSTGDYSWTLTTTAKGGIVAGTIKWSGGDDQLKVTKNGSESVVGYFNKINGQSMVALDSPKNFELLQSSSFQDFINSPFPWIDDVGSYDAWTYFIGDELGFIDTPHPTYYLHTIRAFQNSSPSSYIVFSFISTQSTAYTKSTLYSAFPDKGFQASGFYSSPSSASYRVNIVYPQSATTILFDYGNNSGITTTYGGTYFVDNVRKIT